MEYLSWSKLNLFETSKPQFVRKYILGEEQYTTREMAFGKHIASELENGNLEHIARLDIMEQQLSLKIEGLPTLSYLDSSTEDLSEFIEYKTGKTEWSQDRVDNHGQLAFYAACIYKLTGHIPKCSLIWLETSDEYGSLELTGVVRRFERVFTTEEIEEFWAYMRESWKKMLDMESSYANGAITCMPLLTEMAELKIRIRESEARYKELLEQVEVPEDGLLLPDVGTFYWTTRKKYKYSNEVAEMEKALKERKKEEEQSAECTTTKSLSFR